MFEHKKTSSWYLYPHDKFAEFIRKSMPEKSKAKNGYSTGKPSQVELDWLSKYKIKIND
jgi:hypothetical protein